MERKSIWMNGLVLAALSLVCSAPARATTLLYESTTGNTNTQPGFAVGSFEQILGSRFTLTETTEITAVGGLFSYSSNPGTIYAAILEMDGLLPQGDPYNDTEVLISTTLTPSGLTLNGSDDTIAPLSITLPAGDYALVFGSYDFGATGEAAMPNNGSATAEGAGSFFVYEQTSPFGPGEWKNGSANGTRFLVYGDVIPEPTSLALLGLGGLALLGRTRRRG